MDNGAAVASYVLEVRRTGGAGGDWAVAYRGAAATADCKELSPDSEYEARVAAANAAGTGPPSKSALFRTAPGPPGPPRGAGVTAVTPSSVTLAWQPPAEAHGAAASGYTVEQSDRGGAGGAWRMVARTAADVRSVQVGGLAPGASILLRARALNAAGEGAACEPVLATAAAVPPGPPGVPSFTQVTHGGARVRWGEPAADHGAAVTQYRLEMRPLQPGAPAASWARVYAGPAPAYRASRLAPGGLYEFRAQALTCAGAGPFGPAASVRLAQRPPRPPGAPEILSAQHDSLVVSWAAQGEAWQDEADAAGASAADAVREGAVRYSLEMADTAALAAHRAAGRSRGARAAEGGAAPAGAAGSGAASDSDSAGAWRVVYEGTERHARCGGLRPGTSVLLRVRAHDSFGGSSTGEVTCAATRAANPLPPAAAPPTPPATPSPPRSSAGSSRGPRDASPVAILEEGRKVRRAAVRTRVFAWAGVAHSVRGRPVVQVRYRALGRLTCEYAQWGALLGVLCLYAWLVLNDNIETGKLPPLWSGAAAAAATSAAAASAAAGKAAV